MISNLQLGGPLLVIFLGVGACSSGDRNRDETETAGPEPCTPEWYSVVERTVGVGDGHGHGPDLGSLEWRSAVEFKLGIREDPTTPDPSGDEWCGHINGIIVGMNSEMPSHGE